MSSRIKVAAVSYLNTKPLLWGIEHSEVRKDIELLLDYPANLAQSLNEGRIDLALLPVAAMPDIAGSKIVCNYGIAADGEVASVCIFSEVPMEEIECVYLDYQSRTSIRLAQMLLKWYWKRDVQFLDADLDYISKIRGRTAGVVIGDRALSQRKSFPFIYDLALAWKDWQGLAFVFAAWVTRHDLPPSFLRDFDKANAEGLNHIPEVVRENPFPDYDLTTYYTKNILYHLPNDMEGFSRFQMLLSHRQ